MKIIIAHYKYYIQGGPERYLLKFKELAESKGVEVIPFSVSYPNSIENEYSKYFVQPSERNSKGVYSKDELTLKGIIRGVWNQFHNREAYHKLERLIHDVNPDLLYVLIPGSLSTDIFKVAKKYSIPIILRISDFRLLCGTFNLLRNGEICEECASGKYCNMVKHKCVKNSFPLSFLRMLSLDYNRRFKKYKYVDAVITPPNFTAAKYKQYNYFPKEKIYINPTFIKCENVAIGKSSDNYVLCLGRFSQEKGFIYVVEALKYLADIPVSVAVTGEESNCDLELKEAISKYDLKGKVKFLGFLQGEKLKLATSQALCIAAPAIWYENLPNTVLEAYSFGKPVIASNIGSLAEIVEDKKTGLLFEPKNSMQIAECIRTLYENPELCAQMGRNARIKCESDYSPEAHWQRFIDIYEKIREDKNDKA